MVTPVVPVVEAALESLGDADAEADTEEEEEEEEMLRSSVWLLGEPVD